MGELKISLKAARINVNYTQKQAAKEIGISDITLSKWENGKVDIPISIAQKMADLYKIPIADIVWPYIK